MTLVKRSGRHRMTYGAVVLSTSLRISMVIALSAALPGTFVAVDPATANVQGARLSALGLGPVRFGMTPEQATRVVGQPVTVPNHTYTCGFWKVPGLASDAGQLVSFGSRERLTIFWAGSGTQTTRGISIGANVKHLRRAYRRLKRESVVSYGAVSEHLLYDTRSHGTTYALVFAIYKDKVTSISAGVKKKVKSLGECA